MSYAPFRGTVVREGGGPVGGAKGGGAGRRRGQSRGQEGEPLKWRERRAGKTGMGAVGKEELEDRGSR